MPDQNFFPPDNNSESPSSQEKQEFNPPWVEPNPAPEENPVSTFPNVQTPEPEVSVQPVFNQEIKVEEKTDFSPPVENSLPPASAPLAPPEAEQKAEAFLSSSDSFSLKERPKFGFKKLLIFVLVLGLLTGLFFLVVKVILPRTQKTQEVTLNYWSLWESESVMSSIISEWETKNPHIKINYSQQSPKEYRERLQSALARNEGPDLFRFHITWGPMLKNELEAVPAEVMSATEFESAFYPVVRENLRSGAAFMGLPLQIDTLALFYNQQIFQAAGKTPPTSWDQLRQLALDLTVRDESGRIQTAGVALGTTNNVEHWSDILGLMMLQNGVDLSRPTGNLAEDALTFYTIFNKTDQVWNETLPSSTVAFATGKTAMYFGFTWDVFEIKNLNPNLDFRIVPVPQLPGADIAWASFWAEGVGKRSAHQKEAWEFLKFLSSPETLQKIYQSQSQVRLFGELYPRLEMASLLTGSNPLLTPFLDQANKAKTWYLCSRTFDNGINDRMIKYFEDAINAVNAQNAPAEVLATTAQGVAQLLSQYDLGSSR